ncbi:MULTISPECIES: hypothetical protein [unclassified Streptomyces]|uniref:hypothetical protein n=1 Tax=unclassified Streptomyces TaxID=2593676 RepID=UPI000EF963B1|nr:MULTISPECIES: hypothetical protein [unclassified Streptomyces]QHC18940.1 hypothetical protein GR131_27875 [Streptomyces sp. GF20]
MKRPAHYSDADLAEDQQRQAEHDDVMTQVAAREAQIEHDLVTAADAYESDLSPVSKPEANLARPSDPRHRPSTRRRSLSR